MNKKIIGVTVGTPLSPEKISDTINPVKTVNNTRPDENGNVNVEFEFEFDPTEVEGKADKVDGATEGNFAGLDAEGNLTDSGTSPATLGLSEETGGSLGLTGDDVTVDNAVARLTKLIYDGFGGAIIDITLQGADGTPISNAIISGVSALSGGVATTDANGKVTAMSLTDNPTVTFGGDFADLEEASQVVTVAKDETVAVTLTVTDTIDFAAFTESTTVKISPLCTRLDVSLCGGGGAGGSGSKSSSSASGGGGGGGGYVVCQENVPFTPCEENALVVGAGGDYRSHSSGGTSSFLGLSAAGGTGVSSRTGGTGNGNGGTGAKASSSIDTDATDGTAGTGSIFASLTETEPCGGGGGGGGAYFKTADGAVSNPSGGADGGTPNGGDGGSTGSGQGGDDGVCPGGGGGGGAGRVNKADSTSNAWYGSSGGNGKAALRMWHGNEGVA